MLLFCCPVAQLCPTLQPPGLQHARPLCPSPSPEVRPSSCPLHWWYYPASHPLTALFSLCPQSFPASGTFPMSHLFTSDDQNTGLSAWASVLPVSIQGWFPLRLTGLISLLSSDSEQSQHHSSKASILQHSVFITVQCSQQPMTSGKTIALTIKTFVGKAMSLLFNTLPRFVIAFLPRSNCLLISWLQSPSTMILEPKKMKSVTTYTFSPSICHEVMGQDAMILFFFISFKPALSSSFFTLIKRPFSSSLLSAIRVVSSAHLRSLMFLLPITLIPACNLSSPAFLKMCSAYGLNKQGDSRQPCCTPFSILKQSVVTLRALNVISWLA